MPHASRDRGAIAAPLIATVVAALIGGGAAVTTTVVVVRSANTSATKGVIPAGKAPQPVLAPTPDIVGYNP